MEIYVGRLVRCGALSSRGSSRNVNPEAYSKYGLIMARNEFRQNPPRNIQPHQQGPVEGDFASAISLFHACELLVFQGTRAFRNFMGGIVGPDSKNRKLRFDLGRNPNWLDIRERLDAKFSGDADNSVLNCSVPCVSLTQGGEVRVSQVGSDDTQQQTQGTIPPGHPKGEKLKELVLDHFRKTRAAGAETRVMIFSQYRDSVTEIAAVLRSYRPLVKVMQFVGQAGTKGQFDYSILIHQYAGIFCYFFSSRQEGPYPEGADGGGPQVPRGRLQHSRGHLRWRGGAGHWRGRSHCLLRCLQVPHQTGAEDGADGKEAGREDCGASVGGKGGADVQRLHVLQELHKQGHT